MAVSQKPRLPHSSFYSWEKTSHFNSFHILFQLQKAETTIPLTQDYSSRDPSDRRQSLDLNNEGALPDSGLQSARVDVPLSAGNHNTNHPAKAARQDHSAVQPVGERKRSSTPATCGHKTAQTLALQASAQRACPAGVPGAWAASTP